MCVCSFFFKQKTSYDIYYGLVGSEMCIRDSPVMLEIGREAVYGEASDELLAEAAEELVKEAMDRT